MCSYTLKHFAAIFPTVLITTALWGCGGAPRAEPVPALVVVTEPVERVSAYVVQRTFVGEVQAARRVSSAFELDGLVARVVVRDGDEIGAGDVIAELDTARLEARRRELEQALVSAEAQRRLAQSTLARVEAAHAQRGASAQRLDEARHALEARAAQVRQVAAQIDTVEVDLEKSVLRAPFDAVVAQRLVDDGQVVSSGTSVVMLLERAPAEARIGVSGEAARGLREGERHTIRIGGRSHTAELDAVLPLRGNGTRTVDVVFVLDETLAGDLRSGDAATLQLGHVVTEPGFWLPLEALMESARGLWAAYVAVPLPAGDHSSDGATHLLDRRELEVLHQASGRVYVRGTLEPRAPVVSAGVHRVAPGQRVRLAAHAAPGAR